MKKLIRRTLLLSISCIITLLITSCISQYKTVKDADYNVTNDKRNLDYLNYKSTHRAPAAISQKGFYSDVTPMSLQQPPAWMNRKITVTAQNLPLEFVISRILRNTDAVIEYQPSLNRSRPVSLQYTGTIKGALLLLANNTDTAFQVKGNRILWLNFVTKTFNIAFMPGKSTYQVGQLPNQAGGAAGGGAAGSSTGTTVVTTTGQLGYGQYSDLKGELSVWEDLTRTLNELKSTDGKVIVSESTTSVTAYDHPSNIRSMEQYINQLNKDLSREVQLQVEVLEIELSKQFNYGINWNLVQNWIGTQFSLSGQLATATNITAATQGSGSNNSLVLLQLGKSDGSNAIVNALSQQGRVSVVTQPRVVTLNNQMAQIRITRDTSYLQSVSTTTAVNAGSTTSLTPGIVTDGFTLYILPKIQGNDVYLQISSTLSTLLAIDTVNNIPAQLNVNNDQNSATNNGQFQQIQVPTLSEKQFNQRTLVKSGYTLVITGFQQTHNETQRAQLFGSQKLGATGASRTNTQTLVLITPVILEKY